MIEVRLMEIQMNVCAIIERETGKPVTEDTLLDALDVDSLEFMNLLLVLGDEFGKDVPFEKASELRTVADLAQELA